MEMWCNGHMKLGEIWQKYWLPIVLGMVSMFLIVISLVLLVKSVQTSTPIIFHDEDSATSSAQLISVDVAGAVLSPGVYALPAGSRVEDGIRAAGGLSDTADTELIAKTINRAAIIKDGAKIYVPQMGEKISKSNDTSYNKPISINTASQSELEALPGIGPVTAQKIISGRPYMSLDELVSKKAMGSSLFIKLKDRLSL